MTVNPDTALRWREQAEQHLHQGGFARAVMPGKGDRFPRYIDIYWFFMPLFAVYLSLPLFG